MQTLRSLIVLVVLTSTASAANDLQLLHFTATWCEPCRLMEPAIHRLKSSGYPIRTIDIDRQKALAERFQVRSVPAFILIQDGKIKHRIDQAMSFDNLASLLDRAGAASQPVVRGQSPASMSAITSALGSLGRSGLKQSAAESLRSGQRGRSELSSDAHSRTARRNSSGRGGPETRLPSNSGTRQSPQAQAMAATIRLRVEDGRGQSFGTGTVIHAHKDEVLALTCGHIFRDATGGRAKINVDTFDSKGSSTVRGQLIGYDLDKDVALVSFRPRTPIQPVAIAANMGRIREGVSVFSIGCNRGSDPTIMQGRIKAIDRYIGAGNFVVSGEPIDGRSGGGLFSSDGTLIGVCNAADPQAHEGIYASLREVHHHLDKKGLAFVYRQRNAAPDRLAMADRSRDRIRPERLANRDASRSETRGSRPVIEQTSLETATAPPQAITHDDAENDTEVVVVIRSRRDPSARSKVMVVDRPSPALLNRLKQESNR